eukprot:1506934-Rhodomonas_salina.1
MLISYNSSRLSSKPELETQFWLRSSLTLGSSSTRGPTFKPTLGACLKSSCFLYQRQTACLGLCAQRALVNSTLLPDFNRAVHAATSQQAVDVLWGAPGLVTESFLH